MEFYLGPQVSEEDIPCETAGRFLIASKQTQPSVFYLVPLVHASDKKEKATYRKGFLRSENTETTISTMRIHLLVQRPYSMELATTLVPTVTELQTGHWIYSDSVTATASASSSATGSS